jgi:hypothetical protein
MQQHLAKYQVAALCEALDISRSGYHAWCKRPINSAKRQRSDTIAKCYTQQSCKRKVKW